MYMAALFVVKLEQVRPSVLEATAMWIASLFYDLRDVAQLRRSQQYNLAI